MSTDPFDEDLDRELSAAGASWRSAQAAPSTVNADLFEQTATRRRSRLTAGAIAAAVVLIAGGVMVAANTSRNAGPSTPIQPAAPASSKASADPTVDSLPVKSDPVVPPTVCSAYLGTAGEQSAGSPAPSTGHAEAQAVPACEDLPDGVGGWCAGAPTPGAAGDTTGDTTGGGSGISKADELPNAGQTCSFSSGSCSVADRSTVATCVTCEGTVMPGAPPTSTTAEPSTPPTAAATASPVPTAPTVPTVADAPSCPGIGVACPDGATCTSCLGTAWAEAGSGGSATTSPRTPDFDEHLACPDDGGSGSKQVPAEPAPTTVTSVRPVPPSTVPTR